MERVFYMKKRIMACVCATFMLAGALTGCGSKVANNGTSGEDINIRFSFWEPSTGKETETVLQKIVDSYEEEHPGVNIELVSQASTGYQDWIKAQMAVNSLPEIQMNTALNLISMSKAGLIENISDAFDSPNPYNDNKVWKDTFVDGSLDGVHEYTIEPEYNIPLFGTGIAMFYNKTIYDELGLEVPKNWNEFIENCKVIETAGKTPIAFMGQKNDQISWLFYELSGDIYIDRWMDIDKLNYNMDNHITTYEFAKAVETGDFNIASDKSYQEDFKKLVEYIQKHIEYAPNGSGYDEAAAKTLFLSGKAAHLNSGSWDIVGLLKNDEISFEIGAFKYPKLTTENSEYAGKGISNNCFQSVAISSTVDKQEGAREAAIDFLMYLTSPEQYAMYIEETNQIPSVKEIPVDDMFDAFMEEGGYPLITVFKLGDSNVGVHPWDAIKNVAAGKKIEMDDKFFADMQKSIESWSHEYVEKQKLSAENNYMLDDMPVIGGKRK